MGRDAMTVKHSYPVVRVSVDREGNHYPVVVESRPPAEFDLPARHGEDEPAVVSCNVLAWDLTLREARELARALNRAVSEFELERESWMRRRDEAEPEVEALERILVGETAPGPREACTHGLSSFPCPECQR
jgi:hypothetical protein